jgi:hypothetical protein
MIGFARPTAAGMSGVLTINSKNPGDFPPGPAIADFKREN